MTQSTIDSELRNALEHIWGGGIDYATSPDFKDLTVEEKDALYIRYRDNLIAKAEILIAQEANKARLDELNRLYATSGLRAITLGYISDRIDALTADKEEA